MSTVEQRKARSVDNRSIDEVKICIINQYHLNLIYKPRAYDVEPKEFTIKNKAQSHANSRHLFLYGGFLKYKLGIYWNVFIQILLFSTKMIIT